ncbi:MAG: hypothetical protein HOO96_10380 [Polyangiaceae bacterium]|nr:hypothetical protein [Polyangiaceae bacterium]
MFGRRARGAVGGLAALVLAWGCGGITTGAPRADAKDGGAEASVDAAPASVPVWKATSTQLELRGSGSSDGSFGYVVTQLSITGPEQMAVLRMRTLVAAPTQVVPDVEALHFRIVDASGEVAEYRAAQGDVFGASESPQQRALPTLAYATVAPFMAMVHCLRSHDVPPYPGTASTPTLNGLDLSLAEKVPYENGCINGLYMPEACGLTVYRFEVPRPATGDGPVRYRISLDACFDRTTLHVFRDDVPVVQSAPGTACEPLDTQDALTTGTYWLVVNKANADGCPGRGTAGDMALRVVRLP